MPTKDPKHNLSSVTKVLSSVLYGAVAAGGVALPQSQNASGTVNRAGVQFIQNALNKSHPEDQTSTPLSQTEAIMLYNVVRNVAEKLVDNFHEYRKDLTYRDMAQQDLSDLRALAGADLTPRDIIELEYLLRKSKRELVCTEFDLRRIRQALVDFAGNEAVSKLDNQINIEFAKLENGTEIDSTADGKPAFEFKTAP